MCGMSWIMRQQTDRYWLCMFFGTNAGVVLLVIVPFKKHQIT